MLDRTKRHRDAISIRILESASSRSVPIRSSAGVKGLRIGWQHCRHATRDFRASQPLHMSVTGQKVGPTCVYTSLIRTRTMQCSERSADQRAGLPGERTRSVVRASVARSLGVGCWA